MLRNMGMYYNTKLKEQGCYFIKEASGVCHACNLGINDLQFVAVDYDISAQVNGHM